MPVLLIFLYVQGLILAKCKCNNKVMFKIYYSSVLTNFMSGMERFSMLKGKFLINNSKLFGIFNSQ